VFEAMAESGAPDATAPAPGSAEVERSAWLALGVTTLVFFLTVIDISAVNVAFPSIRESFEVTQAELSWIISGYNITIATGLLLAGRLADSLGRRRVFIPGVAVFMVGSLLCGLAPGVGALIAARVVQAVGGSVVGASALAVVLPDFPFSKRSTVIGIAGATAGLGAVVGPALGSALIDVYSWRAIFLINVPLCLLVLFLAPRLLRESKNPTASGRIDLIGVPVGTLAVALIMGAIVQSESWGLTDPRVAGLAVGGLALFPLLVWRSARHPEPLIDLSLFSIRSFRTATLGAAFFACAFPAGFLVNSLLVQELWEQPIRTTGLAFVPGPMLAAATSPIAGRLNDRFGHRWLLGFGSALCASAYLAYLLILDEQPAVFSRFVPISMALGIGVGLTIASFASASLSDVDPPRFATANATVRTIQQACFAIGIAVVVTLLASGARADELTGYRWAWGWVIGAYLAAALSIVALFPSGSSRDRQTNTPSMERPLR
jgi:EmrB/QacA subfamily drug resistance transporter